MFFHSPMVWRCSDQISQHSFCTDCLKSQRIGFYWFACTINEIGQTVQEEMHRKSRRTRDSARPIMIIFRLGEGIFCRRNQRDRADSGKRKLQKKNSHDSRTSREHHPPNHDAATVPDAPKRSRKDRRSRKKHLNYFILSIDHFALEMKNREPDSFGCYSDDRIGSKTSKEVENSSNKARTHHLEGF